MTANFHKLVVVSSPVIGSDMPPAVQIYVVENGTKAESVISGDDDGVVCLCLDEAKADLVLEALNA